MGQPLSPASSLEIIPISPPPYASSSRAHLPPSPRSSTTLPAPSKSAEFKPSPALRERVHAHLRAQTTRAEVQAGKRKATTRCGAGEGDAVAEAHRKRVAGLSRERVMQVMLNTRGAGVNPITNSDLYSRTDHFVSAATGHQQSNRGGGSAGAATYWEVRKEKMLDQARAATSDLLKGCVFYINGSTGPRVSNLQLQHMITSNGGRFLPMQSAAATHIIANGGLSGSKMQKWINGQGGRGSLKRTKVIRVDWVLDCVQQGKRLSEAGYGMLEDPSQQNLFTAFGAQPKAELRSKAESDTTLS